MAADLIPAFLMGVLAAWLGLSLLARSPREAATRSFALLCLNLSIYGLAIVLGRTSVEPGVQAIAQRVEVAESVLLPVFWLQFIMVVSDTHRLAVLRRAALPSAAALGGALALFALFAPQ
ncbi:MAG: hypothetical protein H7Z42_21430, partial [Roseiflexaceae bacterium]|nr:hypothetical protein [Roseiflexaceae bacterium]